MKVPQPEGTGRMTVTRPEQTMTRPTWTLGAWGFGNGGMGECSEKFDSVLVPLEVILQLKGILKVIFRLKDTPRGACGRDLGNGSASRH